MFTWVEIGMFVVGLVVGFYCRRMFGLCRKAYWHWKLGICWRYVEGPREWRKGTLSNFCVRCGHPAGYH